MKKGSLFTLQAEKKAPPKIFDSLETWKQNPWTEEDSKEIYFYRVKKETKTNAAGSQISYCSVALCKQNEKDIKHLISTVSSGTNGNQQANSNIHIEQGKEASEMVGHGGYVVDSAEGRWLLQKHTDVDHIQPFSIIRARIQRFLTFINQTKNLMNLVIEKYPHYFIKPKGKKSEPILGTQYLYMSYYNYLDNLWLMDHNINSTQKKDKDPLEWLQENNKLGFKFSQFISNNQENTISNLVDRSGFIYTLKKSSNVKDQYQGKSLGGVAKEWIKRNPTHLLSILKTERSHFQAEQLLYFVQDLLSESSLSDEEKGRIETSVNKVVNVYYQLSEARNQLRAELINLLRLHPGLFNPVARVLEMSPDRPQAVAVLNAHIEAAKQEARQANDAKVIAEQQAKSDEEVRIKAEKKAELIEEEMIEDKKKIKSLEEQIKKLTLSQS